MPVKIKQSYWALIFAFASLFTLGLADNIRGTLFPEILNQFELSNTQGSWSFAATSAMAFVASLTSAAYLRRYSISSLLFLGVLQLAVGLAVMGFSSSYNWLLVGSLFLGVGFGFMGVAQNLLVAESVEPRLRSRALSGLHGMYGLASFFAPILAAGTTKFFHSWTGAFYLVAVVCVIFLLLPILFKPNPAFSVHKHENLADSLTKPQRVSKKALLMVSSFFSFYVVAEILISTRLALYMRTYFAMDLGQSATYVTLFFLFLLLGRILFAFIHLPLSLKTQLNSFLVLSIVFLILGLKWHPFFLALTGLSMAAYYPLCVAYISEFSGELSRTFLSYAMSFQSLAVVIMHLGVGYLTDQFGLALALGVGIIALVISIICLNFHPRKLTV